MRAQGLHVVLILAVLQPGRARADDAVDFSRDVRPILAERCFECHSADKRRGALRLDSRAALLEGGNTGPAIAPGDVRASLLMQRVRGEGGEARMPLNRAPLSDEQIELLTRWIEQGAAWPGPAGAARDEQQHWAYVKPTRGQPPRVEHDAWARNDVDRFVLARLEREGLQPSPAADEPALLRRVCLDLIGLPPTPAQMERFLADPSERAYERLVDELLGSPHYGERWARPWLDLARYADSNGYEKDRLRTMWPFRDWVIDALNRDLPFDVFTLEQLAGDMLPNATLAQKVASGFHRNSMLNEEGGVDPEEYRSFTVVDRANTTATVWLGSTIACAQCHNHKFDPFSQKDYYQFYAFFNNTPLEVRRDEVNDLFENSPKVRIPLPDEAELRARIAQLELLLSPDDPAVAAALAAWEQSVAAPVRWTVLDPREFAVEGGAVALGLPDRSILISGGNPDSATYRYAGSCRLPNVTAVRLEVLADDSLGPARGPGRTSHGNFVLTDFRLRAPQPSDLGADRGVPPWGVPAADYEQRTGGEYWAVAGAVDDDPRTGWAIMPEGGRDHVAIFPLQSPIASIAGVVELDFTLAQNFGAQHTIGRLRISATDDSGDVARDTLPAAVRADLAVAPASRSPEQRKRLYDGFIERSPQFRTLRSERAALQRRLDEAPTSLVMQELPQPRATHVQLRGNFLTPGDAVQPDVPRVLPPLPPGAPRDRVTLARWLTSPENPLTARVQVNRLWEAYFGRGLVETSEDFGTRGERPTHPELLDWLACEFVERGWSLKAIHRLIVTSATYRQSSCVTPALLHADPYNKLLARAPRIRLEAELVRDQALAIGGLLSPKVGGPSVMPLQPAGVWAAASSADNGRWRTSAGEDRFRRGLYTFWRRSSPYPAMVTFDAPNREVACTRRSRTNTPLQALTILNDPEFIAPAAGLAQRVLRDAPPDARARLALAFRLCLTRAPSEAESERLLAYLSDQLAHFRQEWAAAEALVATAVRQGGPARQDTAASGPAQAEAGSAAELAAWTMLANVLLNLDETLTRG